MFYSCCVYVSSTLISQCPPLLLRRTSTNLSHFFVAIEPSEHRFREFFFQNETHGFRNRRNESRKSNASRKNAPPMYVRDGKKSRERKDYFAKKRASRRHHHQHHRRHHHHHHRHRCTLLSLKRAFSILRYRASRKKPTVSSALSILRYSHEIKYFSHPQYTSLWGRLSLRLFGLRPMYIIYIRVETLYVIRPISLREMNIDSFVSMKKNHSRNSRNKALPRFFAARRVGSISLSLCVTCKKYAHSPLIRVRS